MYKAIYICGAFRPPHAFNLGISTKAIIEKISGARGKWEENVLCYGKCYLKGLGAKKVAPNSS